MADRKVLHVGVDATCWSNDRGFGRVTRELIAALAARSQGFRYTLLFDQRPEGPLPEGVEVRVGAAAQTISESAVGDSSRSLGYLWTLGRLASQEKFDLFFFPAVYSYFPLLSTIPVVVCFHDAIAERFPELVFPTRFNQLLWGAKTRLASWQATRALTVSEASARDLEEFIGIERARTDVMLNGVSSRFRPLEDPALAARMRERLGIAIDSPLLGYVGGFNRHKNLMRLLKAMPAVIEARPDVQLAIAGDISGTGFWDNLPELRSFANAHPEVEERLHFTGYLDDEDLVILMNAIDALVFPSLCEGFGLPAVEAMRCGTPVLASHAGGLPEVVGNSGLYYDPEDEGAIAATILEFVDGGADLSERLSASSVDRAAMFSWDRAAAAAEVCFRRTYEQR